MLQLVFGKAETGFKIITNFYDDYHLNSLHSNYEISYEIKIMQMYSFS